jgi:ubiquitin-protein ligase
MFDNLHYFHKERRGASAKLTSRLKNEYDMFYDYVPFNFNSSFFVRADPDCPQFIKLLIVGPRGTPYEHGLYLFDIYIPTDYPNSPPKLRFMTNSGVRFNPNLDEKGNVCLSLVGGWSNGMGKENWDPQKSNLPQVVIALTTFFFVDKVVETEPGNEEATQNAEGIYQNEGYSNIIRLNNLHHAMIDNLKLVNKDIVFGDVLEDYFSIKGVEIIEDLKMWIKKINVACCTYEGLTKAHNPTWSEFLSTDAECYANLVISRLEEFICLIMSDNLLRKAI